MSAKVQIALDREVAEDALISVLAQGREGGRRSRAEKQVRAAIRAALGPAEPGDDAAVRERGAEGERPSPSTIRQADRQ